MRPLALVRQFVRQQTNLIGQPVSNMHGKAQPVAQAVQVLGTASWLIVQLAGGVGLTDRDAFYAAFGTTPQHLTSTLDAEQGVIVIPAATTAQPQATMVRGVVDMPAPGMTTVAVSGVGGVYCVYLDGVLQRRAHDELELPLAIDAGRHVLEIIGVAKGFGVGVSPSLSIRSDIEVVPTPSWRSVVTGYLDTTRGTIGTTLSWYNNSQTGAWRILRRSLVTLGPIATVSGVDATGQFGVSITGNFVGNITVGDQVLAAYQVMGTVVQVTYDQTAAVTVVMAKLDPAWTDVNPSWTGSQATTGGLVEINRVPRVSTAAIISYVDSDVVANSSYQYVLQGIGLFNPLSESPRSDPWYIRAGDWTPPGPIVFAASYPQSVNKQITAKFTTPSDLDYQSMRVYYRNVAQSNRLATSATGTTLVDSTRAFTVNALTGYVIAILSGTGAGQLRTIISNTATAVTVAAWATNPDATSHYEIYLYQKVLTDFSRPGVSDQVVFTPVGYGVYEFRTVDFTGNEQSSYTAASWNYTTAADTYIGPNQAPTITITQLTASQQTAFAAPYNDTQNYALVQIGASDPVDGTTGVTIFYQVGAGTSTSFLVTAGSGASQVDNPSGTRTFYVAIPRGVIANWLFVWATDALGLQSDKVTYSVDYNTIPELSTIESRFDTLSALVIVDGAVDDDTNSMRWRLDTGAWTLLSGMGAVKTFLFNFPLGDGQRTLLQLQPCGELAATGFNISSSTNATPIAVTTSASHGYATGDKVCIIDHLVNTAANGQWTITVTGTTTFTLNGSVGSGVGAATGTVLRNCGQFYTHEWMRPPRTNAVVDNRDASGAVSLAWARIVFNTSPAIPLVGGTAGSGTSTGSNTSTTLNDTTKSAIWTTNQFIPNTTTRACTYVLITGGTGAGQLRRLNGNTTTQLTVSQNWTTIPDATSSYQLQTGGTNYRLGSIGGFFPVAQPIFIQRAGSGQEIDYYTELSGITAEAVESVFITSDSTAAIGGFAMVENTANFLDISISLINQNATIWRLYLKKGSWPTIDGTQTGVVDHNYERFEGTTQRTSLPSMTASTATWYGIVVPVDSYNHTGTPISLSVAVTGVGANQGTLANVGVTPDDNGTTASYNKIAWSHNTVLNQPAGGTATGTQSSTTLQDTGQAWGVNALANQTVLLTSGTGSGQFRTIVSNTANTLTVAAWGTTPVSGNTHYVVLPWTIKVFAYRQDQGLGSQIEVTTGLARSAALDAGSPVSYNPANDTDSVAGVGSILHQTPDLRSTASLGIARTWVYTINLYNAGTLQLTTYSYTHTDYYARPVPAFSGGATLSVVTGGACSTTVNNKGQYYPNPEYTLSVAWSMTNVNDTDYTIVVQQANTASPASGDWFTIFWRNTSDTSALLDRGSYVLGAALNPFTAFTTVRLQLQRHSDGAIISTVTSGQITSTLGQCGAFAY